MGAHRRPDGPGAGTRPRRQGHGLYAALRLLSARHVLQQEDLRGSRRRRPAEDHGRVRRRFGKNLQAAGQIRLLPTRRSGRPQRLDDVRRHDGRRQYLLQRRRHVEIQRRGLGQGLYLADRPLQEGLCAEGQRQLGLQRDRRRLLHRHLRDARSGSGCADRHQRAHGCRRLRCRADAEGPGRQDLPDHRLCRLVDDVGQRQQGPLLEADRHPRRPGWQHRVEQAHRRAAGAQICRKRSVLQGRRLQRLVRGTGRQGCRANRHADLS